MAEETFRWVIAGGVMIATLCMVAMAIAAMVMFRVVSRVQARVDAVAERCQPIIDTSRRIVDDLAPKIATVGSSAAEISLNARDVSEVVKDQAHRFGDVGRDIADRTKAQVARVDAAVDETVDNMQHVGENVRAAVKKPVREAHAVMAGVKAAVSTFASGRRPSIDHIPQDEEMFI